MSIVHVNLMEDRTRAPSERRFIRVEVESTKKFPAFNNAMGAALNRRQRRKMRPAILKKQADIFPHECSSEAAFEKKIMVIAGTMAEMLDAEYGEGHDPDDCAHMAQEAYRELRMDFQMVQAPPQERGLGVQE